MRRLSGLLLAGAILWMPALSQDLLAQAAQPQAAEPQAAQPAPAAQESSPLGPPITYTGEVVIAAYTINPGKDADYEKVIATLKDALQKSMRPEARQQLAGWQIIKNELAQGDGSSLYVHIIKTVHERWAAPKRRLDAFGTGLMRWEMIGVDTMNVHRGSTHSACRIPPCCF